MRWYVGFRGGRAEAFPLRLDRDPTPEDDLPFAAVMGPFRTRRAAWFTADTHPNPHIYTVHDAERIANWRDRLEALHRK